MYHFKKVKDCRLYFYVRVLFDVRYIGRNAYVQIVEPGWIFIPIREAYYTDYSSRRYSALLRECIERFGEISVMRWFKIRTQTSSQLCLENRDTTKGRRP